LATYWKFPIREGVKFEFYEKRAFSIEERVKIDEMLLKNGFKIDTSWIEQTYDVKLAKDANVIDPTKKKVDAVNVLHNLHKFYNTDCPCCIAPQPPTGGVMKNNVEPVAESIDEDFEKLLKAIYNKEIITEELLLPIASSYFNVLVRAVDRSFTAESTPYEKEVQTALRNNTSVFAAAKSIDEQKSLASLLVGSDGLAKSFEEFKNEALQIHSYYKGSWLQAEYNYALRSVQSAKQWLQIEAQKDTYKYLRYQTANDELVRASHRILDNVTLPVEHPFWKSHKPPLDWNCRCYIEQVSLAENVELTPSDKIPFLKVPEQFRNNPAVSKLIYNDSMPYFARANGSEMNEAENMGKKL
jgi:Phage Mu protein F like protein